MSAGFMVAMGISTIFKAGSSLIEKRNEQKAYEYNASLAVQEASLIEKQQMIQSYRDQQNKRAYSGQAWAAIASSGVEPTGSPIEVMNANLARIEFDMAVTNYNYEVEKTRARNQSGQLSKYGRQAYTTGLLRAAGHGISGLASAYDYRGAGNQPLGKSLPVSGRK